MRRRTTATTTTAVILLTTAGAAVAATAVGGSTTVPLMPGADTHTYPMVGVAFTDGAIYSLTAANNVNYVVETELYMRSLTEGDSTVALGESIFVAHASGYTMAESGGDLAYLRRDGRLVLRSAEGSETVPAWGTHEDFLGAGPSALSSQWLAVEPVYSSTLGYVGGALFSRTTGARYDLEALTGETDVVWSGGAVDVVDDRVVWSLTGWRADGLTHVGNVSGVWTVALGPSGPTGPVTTLTYDSTPSLVQPTISWAVGIIGGALVWHESLYDPDTQTETHDVFKATAPTFEPTAVEVGDATRIYNAGDKLLAVAWDPDGASTARSLDPNDPSQFVEGSLGQEDWWIVGSGALVAHVGYEEAQPHLTDLKGRTFTDAQPPSAPFVSAVEPPSGSVLGGTTVTVRGTGLTGATQVTFGGTPGTNLQVVSPTKLAVRTPAGTAGVVPVVVSTPAGTSAAAPDAQFAYTELVTQTPLRGVADWSVPAGAVRCQQVAGTNGVPDEATGVIVNVTTVHPTGPGYVVVYPDTAGNGATVPPNSSTVNFEPGADVANGAFVALPDNGKICYSTRGAPNAGVLIDVTGYTLDGSGIVTQPSTRLLDTRAGASHVGEVTGPVNGHQVYTVDVAGRAGVPDDATAVLLNVTVAGVSTLGNLRVFPGGQDVPGTSVLNYAAGREKANGSIVALGPDGTISFWSDTAGTVQVILDVVGYVEAGSAYHGIAPERVMDTRGGGLRVGPIAGPLTSGRVYSLPLAGVDPVPADATAVVLNVTAIGPTSIGNLRVYPDSDGTGTTPPPTASSINYIPGRDIPNQVVVALPANGQVNFYNDGAGGSTVHLAVDVAGYITTPQDR